MRSCNHPLAEESQKDESAGVIADRFQLTLIKTEMISIDISNKYCAYISLHLENTQV